MIKNWEIIRAILLRLEASCVPNTTIHAQEIEGFPEQEVAYNMRLLNNAGFINATIRDSNTGNGHITFAIAKSLTNTGHELLDTIRNESVWSKVKDACKTKGLDMTFDLVLTVGKKIMETLVLA